jgi:hypothetical protein
MKSTQFLILQNSYVGSPAEIFFNASNTSDRLKASSMLTLSKADVSSSSEPAGAIPSIHL